MMLKRLLVLSVLVVVVVSLLISGDSKASIAESEITTINSATITMTMTTSPLPDEQFNQ
jgi:hypothetical protein